MSQIKTFERNLEQNDRKKKSAAYSLAKSLSVTGDTGGGLLILTKGGQTMGSQRKNSVRVPNTMLKNKSALAPIRESPLSRTQNSSASAKRSSIRVEGVQSLMDSDFTALSKL